MRGGVRQAHFSDGKGRYGGFVKVDCRRHSRRVDDMDEDTPTQPPDNRMSQLSSTDVAGMRALFVFYDTNRDGNLSSGQALRIFRLLGLSVNESHVFDLEQMSFAEFVAIIDCHVRTPQSSDPIAEWAVVDHFRSDQVTPHQLAYFLANCEKNIPPAHLDRFLMLYTQSDEQTFVDFPNFQKFLVDYRARSEKLSAIPSEVRRNAVQVHHVQIPEGLGITTDNSTAREDDDDVFE
ncbi:hypothetical protein, variant [Aphanomyces invadans]|uniref:EF-hand domain-containing protein n=1 Tax=Aphanomyces invadans TaxID=157072 RepID=A0A024U273_9STRA|nr:hypothetical protein, variant [Aphanomyces invadans]ETW00315.1 hypothetical protein, variant [Aphanomyces invadans]|eukprot:XP_008871340.1 hypothetical protein, variant [Aphanomyces invadans]